MHGGPLGGAGYVRGASSIWPEVSAQGTDGDVWIKQAEAERGERVHNELSMQAAGRRQTGALPAFPRVPLKTKVLHSTNRVFGACAYDACRGRLHVMRKRLALMSPGLGKFGTAFILHFQGVTLAMYRDVSEREPMP